MPADPVAAGRKGGQSKSPAKLAAARRNGFQKLYDRDKWKQLYAQVTDAQPEQKSSTAQPALFINGKKD